MTSFLTLNIINQLILIFAVTLSISFVLLVIYLLFRTIKAGYGKNSIQFGNPHTNIQKRLDRIGDIELERSRLLQWQGAFSYLKTKMIMQKFDFFSETIISEIKSMYKNLKLKKLKEKKYTNGRMSKTLNNQETRLYDATQDIQAFLLKQKVRAVLVYQDLPSYSTEKKGQELSEYELYIQKYLVRWLEDINEKFNEKCYDLKLPSFKQIYDEYYEQNFKNRIYEEMKNLFYHAREVHCDLQNEYNEKENRLQELSREQAKLIYGK